jgi:hypothetical protein
MIFTRNLYEKGSVYYSIWYSLLNKDREQAKFWTYELYYSGFKKEFFKYIWKIYYCYYAYNNPKFEKFLLRRTLEWFEDEDKDWIIGNIIDNLCLREVSLESWFMMSGYMSFPEQLEDWIQQIENSTSKDHCFEVIEKCSLHFRINENNKTRIIDSLRETFEKLKILDFNTFLTACFARIMTVVFVLMRGKEKRLYLIENPEEIKKYKTPLVLNTTKYRRKKPKTEYTAHIYPLQKEQLTIENYENWVYHAYGSPIWKKRIETLGGKMIDKQIVFDTEEHEEEFYNKYSFEPDEQPKEVKEKWLGKKDFESWEDLYAKYKVE